MKAVSGLSEAVAHPAIPAPKATAITEDPVHLEGWVPEEPGLLEVREQRGPEVEIDCLLEIDRETALPERRSGRAQLLTDIGKVWRAAAICTM